MIRPREARAAKGLTVVLESEVTILDPHFTTAAITRTFGLHVFDMLFAMNEKGEIKPQMVDSCAGQRRQADLDLRAARRPQVPRRRAGDGGRLRRLAEALGGARCAGQDADGRHRLARAEDARTFEFVLKQPFPLMLDVLGKPNAPLPVIMPARIAAHAGATSASPNRSARARSGSCKDQWRPGNTMLLERNPDYVPRHEPPDFLAGGKKVKIDQLTLRVMPDQSTGANALMAGEIDYMQYLPFDMLPILEKDKSVKLMGLGGIHQFQGNFRLNHAFPPFDNPAVRKVLWKLVDQDAT